MSRAPILIRVELGRLVPVDAYAQQQVDELGDGKEFNARLSRITATGREEREGLRGMWFAGLKLLSENTDDPRYNTPEKAYRNIRLDLGFSRPRHRIDGSVEMVPVSTADDNMDDEEMAALQELARGYCQQKFGFDPFQMWADEKDAEKAMQQRARR